MASVDARDYELASLGFETSVRSDLGALNNATFDDALALYADFYFSVGLIGMDIDDLLGMVASRPRFFSASARCR